MSFAPREIINRYVLDVNQTECRITVGMVQGDDTRVVEAVLTSGGRPVELPFGSTAVFMGETEGGAGIFDPCDVYHDTGVVRYKVTPNVSTAAGTVVGNLRIQNRDGTVLMAPIMAFHIIENRFVDAVVDSPSYDALANLVAQFTSDRADILEDEGYRSEGEEERVAAEEQRQRAEAERQAYINELKRQVEAGEFDGAPGTVGPMGPVGTVQRSVIDAGGEDLTLSVQDNFVYEIANAATLTVEVPRGAYCAYIFVSFSNTETAGIVLPAGMPTFGADPAVVAREDSWEIALDSAGGAILLRK